MTELLSRDLLLLIHLLVGSLVGEKSDRDEDREGLLENQANELSSKEFV